MGEEQLFAAVKREAHARCEANMEPLPGPLAEAFGPDILVHGIRVRPVVHYDFVLLRILNSPLYRQLLQSIKPEEEREKFQITTEDGLLLVYLFITPIRELVENLKRGQVHFKACALSGVSVLSSNALAALIPSVISHFWRCFDTSVQYGPPEKDGSFHYSLIDASDDGLGWWLNYFCRLIREYHFTREDVLFDLPVLQGRAMLAWSVENDSWLAVERKSAGYIKPEIIKREVLNGE